jgi:succinate-semialdehyde dehydrogenase/glutarate-semialdehyde dehydrogenase
MNYQSINPFNGETLKTFVDTTDAELDVKIAAADACFKTWRCLSFAERAAIASKAASIMRSHVDEFARPITLEMGKRFEEAQGEVALSADIIDYYAKNAEAFLAPVTLNLARWACCLVCSPGIFRTTSSRVLQHRI